MLNTGNVALRDIDITADSDYGNWTCQPSLGSPLPVGSSMSCTGLRKLTPTDFDNADTTWVASVVTSNILPAASPARVFKQHFNDWNLAPQNLPRVASFMLGIQGCYHSAYAGKDGTACATFFISPAPASRPKRHLTHSCVSLHRSERWGVRHNGFDSRHSDAAGCQRYMDKPKGAHHSLWGAFLEPGRSLCQFLDLPHNLASADLSKSCFVSFCGCRQSGP